MQPTLFDVQSPPESLPYQGRSVETQLASLVAAERAAARRPALWNAYLDLLLRRGVHGLTDHEAAAALERPVSSICSTRASRHVAPHLVPHGHRPGPYGEANTVFVLRICLGVAFDREGREAPHA